jgi:hypothetical protein
MNLPKKIEFVFKEVWVTPILISPLFTIVKIKNLLQCPSTDEIIVSIQIDMI